MFECFLYASVQFLLYIYSICLDRIFRVFHFYAFSFRENWNKNSRCAKKRCLLNVWQQKYNRQQTKKQSVLASL